MCCKCSHQSFLPSECTFYQSLFLPWGWFIVDLFSSACSVIRTDGNMGQVCVVTSEWSYLIFWYLHCKKMFSDCYMFSEVILNPFDWLFFVFHKRRLEKWLFSIYNGCQWALKVGGCQFGYQHLIKNHLCVPQKKVIYFWEPRERVFIFGWTIPWPVVVL